MNEKVNGYEINTVNKMNVRKIGGMARRWIDKWTKTD